MAILETKDLRKIYGSGENEVHALDGVSISVEEGEFVAVIGTSGSGKSTLLNMIGGLDRPTSGSVTIRGKELLKMKDEELTIFRRRNIGFVFQNYNLLPVLNVYENIVYPIEIDGGKTDTGFVQEIIHILGLERKLKNMPNNLSGGQQQRVALARGIVMQPKVLLLDEPLSAIDAKLRKSLQLSIREIHNKLGLTTIFVTHDQDEAMVMSDVIHLFHDGVIEQSGTPVEVYTRPVTSFAASFIGNYNIFEADKIAKLTGTEWKTKVAIRPETIMMSKAPIANDDRFKMEGVIKEHIARGNVLRYTIDVGGIEVYADALFRSVSIFQDGEKVYLSIAEHNCVAI